MNDGTIVQYIYKSLYHEYIKLSEKESNINKNEICSENYTDFTHKKGDLITYIYSYNPYLVDILKKDLNEKQRIVIVYSFLCGYTDIEISKKIKVSKQYIGKLKKQALFIIKKKLN